VAPVRLINRLTRCGFHDRPLPPLKIAEMEEATSVHPGAVAELWASSDQIPNHSNPDLIDCGNSRCRKRRGLS
jgi:hypothetical protein